VSLSTLKFYLVIFNFDKVTFSMSIIIADMFIANYWFLVLLYLPNYYQQ